MGNIYNATHSTLSNQSMPLALVLLGKSGAGKSASGNTILGETFFRSEASSRAITTECKKSEEKNFHGRNVIVIDTPDVFFLSRQVRDCREMCEGHVCVYLLVLQIGRFTEGERDILKSLEKTLQTNIRDRAIILFTYGDNLMSDQTIDDYVNEAGEDFQNLIKKCGNRYLVINNKDTDKKEEQVEMLVEALMKKIDELPEVKKESEKCWEDKKWLLAAGIGVVVIVIVLSLTLAKWPQP
ncbi:GTPase IMAP family member 8-like isoform X2 [Engraulis encrasicolus]|uniref:GTPase IMAP family member 8-like isoform X2 n=1 Tax=Engraulis encrasicolus TaxID=184585 RepID=UPI002FD05C66